MATAAKRKKLNRRPRESFDDRLSLLKESFLYEVAEKVPKDYRRVLVQLGIKDYQMDITDIDHSTSVVQRAYNGFLIWVRNSFGKKLKEEEMVNHLVKSLETVCRNDLVKMIKDAAAEKGFNFFDANNDETTDSSDSGEEHHHNENNGTSKNYDDDYDANENNGDDGNIDENVDDSDDDDDDDDDDDIDDNDETDDDDDDDDDDSDDEEGQCSTSEDEGVDLSIENEYLSADKCIVAGLRNIDKVSCISQMQISKKLDQTTVKLRVISKSPIIMFGQKKTKERIEFLLQDGVTTVQGVAFEEHAYSVNERICENQVYAFSNYKVKMTNTIPPYMQIWLFANTRIRPKTQTSVGTNSCNSFKIRFLKQDDMVTRLVSLNPVIVTAVSPLEKPKRKYLRMLKLKDYTDTIIMNMWHENPVKCLYKRGNILDLKFATVGEFGGEYYLTYNGVTKMNKLQENRGLMQLLIDENADEFENLPMSIDGIKRLNRSMYRVTLGEAQIVTFKTERESDLVYSMCNVVENHGKIERKAGKLYCERCRKPRRGKHMVLLNAEITDRSGDSIWVQIFDKCSRQILRDDYAEFKKMDHDERVQILKDIKDNPDEFFEFQLKINVNEHGKHVIAQNILRL